MGTQCLKLVASINQSQAPELSVYTYAIFHQSMCIYLSNNLSFHSVSVSHGQTVFSCLNRKENSIKCCNIKESNNNSEKYLQLELFHFTHFPNILSTIRIQFAYSTIASTFNSSTRTCTRTVTSADITHTPHCLGQAFAFEWPATFI